MSLRKLRFYLWQDTSGSIATMFGISLIPAVLMAGAAVDYSRAAAQWSNLQQATDATALATAHTYLNALSTSSSLKTFAQTYVSGLMNGATVTSAMPSQNNTQVCVATNFNVPTVFMKIARISNMNISTVACAQVGATYEVAMALDNSGSMADSAGGQSKVAALQSAASQLVSILIPSGTTAPIAAISIAPFTSMVNVGSSVLSSATFLDSTGGSSIHWQNFHRPSGTVFRPTSKFDMFNAMTNASWGGCVEERPPPYTTTDTAASTATPDSMFVPYFAPDEPGAVDTNGYACYPTGSSNCGRSIPPYIFFNSYIADNGSATTAGVCSTSSAYASADNATTYSGDNQTNIYPGAGLSMVCKYKGTKGSYTTSAVGLPSGPNLMCNSQQMTPLTTDTTTLNNAINAMVANGSTNLIAGFMWAWRSISPVVAPFPVASVSSIGPQNPKAYSYGPPPNTKVIILMTDGFNSWTANPYNTFGSLYEAFGYYANNRIASYSTAPIDPATGAAIPGTSSCSGSTTTSSNSRCEMDNVTLESCNNAKKAGVIIYTVGFSTSGDPIDAPGLTLLQNCASSSSNFYQPSDSTTILQAFQQIAASIKNLRLSQ